MLLLVSVPLFLRFMKLCPKCQTKYTDDSLNYCLQDGKTLDTIIEDKTLVLDADSIADEPTISENISDQDFTKETEVIPRSKTKRSSDENRSVETVVSSAKMGKTHISNEVPAKRKTGIGLVAGFGLSGLLVGILGAGIYFANSYSMFGTGSLNSNTNANNQPVEKPTVLSDSADVKVSASSTRKADLGNIYTPKMAFDGNPRTAWGEGVKGEGKKQWIAFDFAKEEKLNSIVILPGYFKTPAIWRKNNRLASVVVEFSDNSKRDFNFADVMTEQTLEIGGIKTNSVFIVVKDIFPGESDTEDTLISEVSFIVE